MGRPKPELNFREDILEPARLAPSAMNRQTWYFSGDKNKIHFYMADDMLNMKKITEPLGLADPGIALCHLWLAAQHSGIPVIKKHHHIASINIRGA
ncbi:hypothetical protein AGMMS49579_06630 [Spirochaetia bacterium]|nr:hypothetical protein AGMMS49579_06630 [Spirochaetia bacterium]